MERQSGVLVKIKPITDIDSNMPKILIILFCVASFLLGTAVMYQYNIIIASRQHNVRNQDAERWFELMPPSNSDEKLISYSSDLLFRSDIKLPNVTSLTGRAKFVKNTVNNKPEIKLGYTIDADIAPLDVSALPEKYQQKPQDKNAQSVKPLLDKVHYDVIFYFILKDRDGFPLMKVTSNKETVSSGTHNHFQLFANNYISQDIAANTDRITMRMEVIRCLSCISETENRSKRHSLFQTFMR